MTDQPEALRLAELIDNDLKNSAHHVEAAAELRRLHAECEALRQIVADYPPIEAELREVVDSLFRAEAERDALRNLLDRAADMLHECGLRDEIYAALKEVK